MGRKKVRIPEAREVRFELVNYSQLYLRKVVQVVTGPGEVTEVDVSIDMTLGEWNRLQKQIKRARSRKKEKKARQMSTISRRTISLSSL